MRISDPDGAAAAGPRELPTQMKDEQTEKGNNESIEEARMELQT